MNNLSEQIYKILTSREFRAGKLPSEDTKKIILEEIENKLYKNLPIKLLQAWGGCKNPNLPIDCAELCEEAVLKHLNRLNDEIIKIYKPGLKIYICLGDERVRNVNRITIEKTEKYVKTLIEIADRYRGLFLVVPISVLYKKYSSEFLTCLTKAKQEISNDIYRQAGFKKLVSNARKNIFTGDLDSENKIAERSKEAAKDYIIYRVAEEEARIFRQFDDCIRSFFIKYVPFYKNYIKNISKIKPRLDSFLIFYTGKKGNITQPWQAIGREDNGEILFLSQERLKNLI